MFRLCIYIAMKSFSAETALYSADSGRREAARNLNTLAFAAKDQLKYLYLQN